MGKKDQFLRNCVFAVSNLSLYTENWDCMLDTFYRDASKFWIFIWAINRIKID